MDDGYVRQNGGDGDNEGSSAAAADDAPLSTPPAPRAIIRLPQDVVNLIAAGEIIQRPANALKEMMENSLDAGARMIRIQLRDGGLGMLQIQDDGHGVARADLPLLCERFATSKLRSFADLANMTTFGFRGEALASISYVSATMSVVSKTDDSPLAYKASYSAGKLVAPKPGQSAEPKPCAGSRGTFITAEDLFYNVPQRKRALKSATEEYSAALEVVSKYAVHYGGHGIGFSCKKSSSPMVDLSIPSSEQTTTLDVVGMIYGSKTAKQLLRLEPIRDDMYKATMEGYVSNASWQSKRAVFLLFINNRLVDAPALRRSVLALYATILPKGAHPWIYISLHIDEANVDVNVHPTKREVHFLHEEDIIEILCTHLQSTLSSANTQRTFEPAQHQSTLSGMGGSRSGTAAVSQMSLASNPQHTVRVDARSRTLEEMGVVSRGTAGVMGNSAVNDGIDSSGQAAPHHNMSSDQATRAWSAPEIVTLLESVHELRQEVRAQRHAELTEILRNHKLIGIIGSDKASLLLQHKTKLFLVRYPDIIHEVAYQLALKQFGQLNRVKLQPSPTLHDLLLAGVQAESAESHERRRELGISTEQAVQRAERILCDKADMFKEYFGVVLEGTSDVSTARLVALPNILGGGRLTMSASATALQLARVPTLMLRLATKPDYTAEKACFASILSELAWAHTPMPSSSSSDAAKRAWTAIWAPAMRNYTPSRALAKSGAVTMVTSLPSLYSVFERC